MKQKSQTYSLKFSTPLTPSVEKLVNLHGIREAKKMYYLVNGEHKGMVMLLTRRDCEWF
jgi:hypothetical protein